MVWVVRMMWVVTMEDELTAPLLFTALDELIEHASPRSNLEPFQGAPHLSCLPLAWDRKLVVTRPIGRWHHELATWRSWIRG